MRIHVVGVAGTGMGSLAGLLAELGHELSGSDVAFDPPIGPYLDGWGIRCMLGFDARHVEPPPDLVVVGNVCRKDNPEAARAFANDIPVTHIAGALQRFVLPETSPLVVAGTHGKTTTSALAAFLLEASGLAPGFLIGGIPGNFQRSFRKPARAPRRLIGPGTERKPPFVIEGDEYDTAFFEKTPKFIHYGAEVAIVTSIEHDHIDIYPAYESYVAAFERFVATVPEHGLIVANAADPEVVRVVTAGAKAEVVWTGLQGDDTHGLAPHFMAAPAGEDQSGTSFDLYAGGVFCGRFAVPLYGRHNVENVLAALAAVVQGFGARLDRVGPALARFRGVHRRQELLGEPGGVRVFDDFAHHPTAVRKTLLALRSCCRNGTLFAIFEPRSATACRSLHQAEYTRAFDACDYALFAPVARKGLPDADRLDVERLVLELRARGKRADHFPDPDAIVARSAEFARAGDVIAVLSNGAFGGIHEKLLARLGKAPHNRALENAAVPPNKEVTR